MTTLTEQLLDDALADALLEREKAAVESIVGPLRKAIIVLTTQLEAVWPGDEATPAEKRLAFKRLSFASLSVHASVAQTELFQVMLDSLTEGIDQAETQLKWAGELVPSKQMPAVEPQTLETVEQTETKVDDKLSKADVKLKQADTLAEVKEAGNIAQSSVSTLERDVRTVVHSASNQGHTSVIDRSPTTHQVWKAERDACVHCLAYSGQIDKGKGYPPGLTFGNKPLKEGRIRNPPLHPNCRCEQVAWSDDWQTGSTGLPQALQREAQRSILRGWSLESESERVRLRAAQDLLKRGVQMPRSVRQYAAQAIKAGAFKRGRAFPE